MPRATAALTRDRALARELESAACIPYAAHVTDDVVCTNAGDFVFAFRLAGRSFETADDVDLNQLHERLNGLLRNIASASLALWTHVVRRRAVPALGTRPTQRFAAQLADLYGERLAGTRLMSNELYLTVVWRATPGATTSWMVRLAGRRDRALLEQQRRDALDTCAKLGAQLFAALTEYGAVRLGIYSTKAVPRSQLLEFLALLVNGESQPMPLSRAPINHVLATVRPFFGAETLEYRAASAGRLGAFLGIREYPHDTSPDCLHRLLTAPFPYVLTQSFAGLAKPAAQGLLIGQYNRMRNAGDLARSQAEALNAALDALAGNALVFGDHHFSLQVMTDPVPAWHADRGVMLKQLAEHVAIARELLADTGMVVAREDLALEAAFWAQLPGNFAYRPRKAPITSRNFVAMNPLHNYPAGRSDGNHWGEALALLTTRASSPYAFSMHASDAIDAAAASDIGHTFICGPTGSGKTVFLGFCMAMATRLDATQVVFDKDRGLEILVRALGGAYLPLKTGEPTGFNPLRLETTHANVAFLREWLARLVHSSARHLSAREERDLEQALRGALALEPTERRLSRVLEHLDATDPDGLYPRLARWCAVAGGELAWVFDHEDDKIVPLLSSSSTIGVDVTEFLDSASIRTPVTMYLFHLIRQLLDGRRFICWCDEFWKLLGDPAFEVFARDGPKTWRKLNGVFAASTQSAADVLASPISRTLVEQTATKVFFPNPEARAEDYVQGLGLTEREWRLIREQMTPGSREFLVKQGHSSVVCRLDLAGFDAELAVISGRVSSVQFLQRLLQTHGEAPDDWLPEFVGAHGGSGAAASYESLGRQRGIP